MAGGRKIVVEFLGKDVSAGSTASKVEQKFGKLGGKLDRVGQASGKLLAGGALVAGAALVKMGQGAASDEQAASRLAQTLKVAAGATRGQIADTEAWITTMGKAYGVSDDQLRPALGKLAAATGSVEKAQKLARLAMDVSVGTGKDYNAVAEALAKAQTGNVGALGRLGVATKDTNGKTMSLQKITAKLADTYKGAASKNAQTTAGKQKILQVQLAEMGETIGYKVIPYMQKMVDVGFKLMGWAEKHATTLKIVVGALAGLAAVLYATSVAMRIWATSAVLAGVAQGVFAAATGAGTAALVGNTVALRAYAVATKIGAATQWLLNAAMTANPIGLVVLAIAALVAGLVIAYKKSETFRRIVNGAFAAVKNAASVAFNWVKKNWPLLLAIVTGPIGLATLFVVRHWKQIKDGASSVVTWIRSRFSALVGFVTGLPGRMGRAARGMFDGIKNAFKGAVNWIIRKWNSLSFSLPGVKVPGIGKIGGFSLNTPNIPLLAKGGSVTAAGAAIVGERGPEMLSLPRGAKVSPLAKGAGGGGDTYEIHIHGVTDSISAGREIEKVLAKYKRVGNSNRPLAFERA
jgi:hypothetical protein